jgi:hypothetical protein
MFEVTTISLLLMFEKKLKVVSPEKDKEVSPM